MNGTAPKSLQSLLFTALVAAGLFFAGCNAGAISGPEAVGTTTVKTAADGGGGQGGGDNNDDCSVDPTGCQGRTGD
jgi:hypothetical protein